MTPPTASLAKNGVNVTAFSGNHGTIKFEVPLSLPTLPGLTMVDRYVLATIFRPMRNVFLFVLLILESVRFRLGLGLAMHQDNFFALVFTYMAQWLALYSGLAMQMALAVGVMFGFARLAQNRELDAMHALGYGLHRLMRPILAFGIIIAAADIVILGWLQPLSLYQAGSFVHQVQRFVSLLPEGGDLFVSNKSNTVVIDSIAPKSNSFGKIFVYQSYADGKTVVTGGGKGHLAIVEDDPNQYYQVSHVNMMQIIIGHGAQGRALPDSYNASSSSEIKGPVQAIDTSNFRKRGASEWEMTLPELAYAGPPNGFSVSPYAISAELNYRIVQALFVLVAPFIAVLFVVEQRRNPGPFRFLGGLLAILSFHQFLGIAVSFSRSGVAPVWLTLWLPFVALCLIIAVLFRRLSLKPGFSSAR